MQPMCPPVGGCGRGWHSCGTLRSSGLVCTHFTVWGGSGNSAHPRAPVRQCPVGWEYKSGRRSWCASTPLLMHLPAMLAGLPGGPRLLPILPCLWYITPSSLGGFPCTANPSCPPRSDLLSPSLSSQPHPALWRSILGFGVPDSSPAHLCRSPSALPSVIHLLCSPPRLPKLPILSWLVSLPLKGLPRVQLFPLSQLPPEAPGPIPLPFLSFSLVLPRLACWEVSGLLPALSRCSVRIVSTHKCICDVYDNMSYTSHSSAISIRTLWILVCLISHKSLKATVILKNVFLFTLLVINFHYYLLDCLCSSVSPNLSYS